MVGWYKYVGLLGLRLGWDHCVVFLGKTIYSYSTRARSQSKILEEGPQSEQYSWSLCMKGCSWTHYVY